MVGALWLIIFLTRQYRKFNWKHVFIACALFFCVLLGVLAHSETRNSLILILQGKLKALLGIRYYLGLDGINLAKEHMWFGWGGTTAPLYYLKSFPEYAFPNWHLHVNPIQLWMEFGGITVLGLVILFGTYLKMGWHVLQSNRFSVHEKYLAQGILGSSLVYLSFFTDCSWCTFGLIGTFCLISSLLFVLRKQSEPCSYPFGPKSRFILIGLTLLLLNTIICADWQELAGRCTFDEFLQAVRDKPQTMIEKLNKAIQVYPDNLYFYNQGANLIAWTGYPFHIRRLRNAIRYFEDSLKHNPWQTYPHENLGALYERCGDHVESARHYLADIEFLPNDSLSYLQLIGLLKEWCSDQDLIDQWLGLAVFNEPRLLALGYFNRWYLQSPKAQDYTWSYYERYQDVSFQRAALALFLRNTKHILEQKKQMACVIKVLSDTEELSSKPFSIRDFTLKKFVGASQRIKYTFGPYFYPEDGVKRYWDRFILRGSIKNPQFMISTLVALIMPVTPPQRKWFHLFDSPKYSDLESHVHARECIRELKEKTLAALKIKK